MGSLVNAVPPAVGLADAARAQGSLRRVWESPGRPPLLLAELRDVHFWIAPGVDGVIFLADGSVVAESARFLRPVNAPKRTRGRAPRAPRPQEIGGEFDEVFLPVDPGWTNYFHWLLLHVPAIRAADAWLDPSVPAALPRHEDHLALPKPVAFASEVMKDSLGGVARPLRALAPGAYRARRLYRFLVDSPQQAEGIYCAPWWEALLALVQRMRASVAPAAEGGSRASGVQVPVAAERIYVSRSGAQGRPFAAEGDPAFGELLAQQGFVLPRLAGCGLAEQARVFRGARRVIGPHGSGLANLLFCAPGAAVLEFNAPIAGEAAARSHFRRLAECRGLAYTELRADLEPMDVPTLREAIRRWLEEAQ